MSKKLRIITLVLLMVICCIMFGSCQFTYGNPDSLEIGSKTVGERVWIGLQIAFLGVGVVFLVLIILILMVSVMKYSFVAMDKIKAAIAANKAKKEVKDEPVDAPVVVKDESVDADEEVMAAITAALMAYYDAETKIVYESNVKFKVRSIKQNN